MAIIPLLKAKIENCVLIFDDREKYNNWIAQLNDNKIEVIIRKPKKVRSDRQNRYYWGVVLKLITECTGESGEDLHNHFSYRWLGTKGKSGKLISRKSTTSLSTVEFMEYLDKIISWGEKFLNITFPNPEDIELDFVNY